jgi:hypothetical protein
VAKSAAISEPSFAPMTAARSQPGETCTEGICHASEEINDLRGSPLRQSTPSHGGAASRCEAAANAVRERASLTQVEHATSHHGQSRRTSMNRYAAWSGKCVQIPPPLLREARHKAGLSMVRAVLARDAAGPRFRPSRRTTPRYCGSSYVED